MSGVFVSFFLFQPKNFGIFDPQNYFFDHICKNLNYKLYTNTCKNLYFSTIKNQRIIAQ